MLVSVFLRVFSPEHVDARRHTETKVDSTYCPFSHLYLLHFHREKKVTFAGLFKVSPPLLPLNTHDIIFQSSL